MNKNVYFYQMRKFNAIEGRYKFLFFVVSKEYVIGVFKDSKIATAFIHLMRKQKPRYIYPQCRRLNSMRKYYSDKQLIDGMDYCIKYNTATIFELSSYIIYKHGEDSARKYIRIQTVRSYINRSFKIREVLHG